MTSTILSDQQKAALYELRFSPEQIMLLNEKPDLAVEIICNPFIINALGHEKIISFALTKSSIFSDINALLYCKFSQQHILYLLQIDESGESLRLCLNHARRFQHEGIFPQIGHAQIIKLLSDKQNGHRRLWEYSIRAKNNATQQYTEKSLLLQTIFSPPQKTDKEWLAASGYNHQQIVSLVNHSLEETFITVLKNLHHQLITEFTHEEIVFIINNSGVIALDLLVKYYAQLREHGFNKYMILKIINAPMRLCKFESLSMHAPMLLKEQFTEEDLIDLLLEYKGELLLEFLAKAHPFLTEVLDFSNRQMMLLAKSSDGVERWNGMQSNYHSLIALGVTKQELSQLGAHRSSKVVLVLLKHHRKLYQLGFYPKDMLALAKQKTGAQNIKAILHYRHTPQESSFTNPELIKITARHLGYKKLSALNLCYKKLCEIGFGCEQIVDLASRSVANIEIIAQFGLSLKTMNFTLCQILEIAKPNVTEYLKSIVSNGDFLRAHHFQPDELYALAKISKGNNIINEIKKYFANIHYYKFPFSRENLVKLLTAQNGIKIVEAINKYQDKLHAWRFKREEFLSYFVYKHSFAYLNILDLHYNELQQLGFKKNHLISLASKSQAVFLLNAAFAEMKSFQEKQLLHTISIERVIEELVLKSEKSNLLATLRTAASSKRKIDEVKEPVVHNYEESKGKLVKAIEQLFPEENIEEVIVPITLAKPLLVGIPYRMSSEFGFTIEIINVDFYKITRDKELFAQYKNNLMPKRVCFGANPNLWFRPPVATDNSVTTSVESTLDSYGLKTTPCE